MDGWISDLFFNMQHDQRDALYAEMAAKRAVDQITETQDRAALQADADWFALAMKHLGHDVAPDALITDFLTRL